MRKRLTTYLKEMDALLADSGQTSQNPEQSLQSASQKDGQPVQPDYSELCKQHLIQIQFFQHERLIHLIVTCLFAILAFAVFITLLFTFSIGLLLLFGALFILLVPYIRHYYFLENGVQKMYEQYDRLLAISVLETFHN